MLIWSYFQLAVLGTFTALSPSYVVYCIFRFLTGMSVSGVILNAVSLSECLSSLSLQERTGSYNKYNILNDSHRGKTMEIDKNNDF